MSRAYSMLGHIFISCIIRENGYSNLLLIITQEQTMQTKCRTWEGTILITLRVEKLVS